MCSRCGVPARPAPDRGYKEDWIGYSGWLLPCWRHSSVSPSILVRVQPSAIAKGQKENGFCGHKTFSHLSYFEFSADLRKLPEAISNGWKPLFLLVQPKADSCPDGDLGKIARDCELRRSYRDRGRPPLTRLCRGCLAR